MLVSGGVQAPPDKLRSSYLVYSYVAKRIANIRLTSGMEWRSRGESIRLNTEKGLSKMIYGDRIDAYRCEHCNKIIISYE